MNINPKDVYHSFNPDIISRGTRLLNDGPINLTKINSNKLFAEVGDKIKKVVVSLAPDYEYSDIKLQSKCECNKKLCVHAAAAVLYYLQNKHKLEPETTVLSWINELTPNLSSELKSIKKKNNPKPSAVKLQMLYILKIINNNLYVTLTLSRLLKSGRYGVEKDYWTLETLHPR